MQQPMQIIPLAFCEDSSYSTPDWGVGLMFNTVRFRANQSQRIAGILAGSQFETIAEAVSDTPDTPLPPG